MSIKDKIARLRDSLHNAEEKGVDLSKGTDSTKSFYDFKERKQGYYRSSFEGSFNDLKKSVMEIASECKDQDAGVELLIL